MVMVAEQIEVSDDQKALATPTTNDWHKQIEARAEQFVANANAEKVVQEVLDPKGPLFARRGRFAIRARKLASARHVSLTFRQRELLERVDGTLPFHDLGGEG